MGFKKSAEEVARIQSIIRSPRFVAAEMLTVDFLTERHALSSALPPGMELDGEPVVTAMVGRWRSNCVGDYCGGALYVPARFGGTAAAYVLAMYMDADPAIMFGRDVFGEPKKRATSHLFRRGSSFQGYVERNGVRLIELSAELGPDLGPSTASGANFNIKATPAADGSTCEDDAVVTLAEFDNALTERREGAGTVTLGSSVHDPLGDLVVVEHRGAAYIEGDLIARARAFGRIPKDLFFPYLLGRMDDWSQLNTEDDIRVVVHR